MKERIRATLWLTLLCCTTLAACGERTDPLPGGALTPASVTRSERTLVDTTRVTARNGSYPGAPDRTLRALIWQPASAAPVPLFIMAHGYTGLPERFEAMASAIAAAGYIVAAPAFPLTNDDAPGGVRGFQDLVNQPGDVSFVISQLLAANAGPDPSLHNRIRATDIAVLGHSLGGATITALTRKNCCRDARVRAAILFAPAPIDFFDNLLGADPISAGPPTLILNGSADQLVPISASMQLYQQIDPPKVFVGVTGADHSDAIEALSEPLSDMQLVSEHAIVAFLNAMFRGAKVEFINTLAALAAEGNPVESDGTLP